MCVWGGGGGGRGGGILRPSVYQTSSACTSPLFPVDQFFQLFCLSVVRLKLKKMLNEAPRCIIILHEDTEKMGLLP